MSRFACRDHRHRSRNGYNHHKHETMRDDPTSILKSCVLTSAESVRKNSLKVLSKFTKLAPVPMREIQLTSGRRAVCFSMALVGTRSVHRWRARRDRSIVSLIKVRINGWLLITRRRHYTGTHTAHLAHPGGFSFPCYHIFTRPPTERLHSYKGAMCFCLFSVHPCLLFLRRGHSRKMWARMQQPRDAVVKTFMLLKARVT